MVDTNDEWIVTRTGISERHIAGPDETTASMAAVAGLRAIATAGLDPDDIDLILVGTLTPDYAMPSTAALVKEAIGNKRAAAMDLYGRLLGLRLRLCHGQCLCRERHGEARPCHRRRDAEPLHGFLRSRHLHPVRGCGRRGRSVGLGRARGDDGHRDDDGPDRRRNLIWLPAGGAARPPTAATLANGEHYMKMKGTETFKMAVRTLGSTAVAAVKRAGLQLSDIDLVVPHQANVRIIEALAKSLDLPDGEGLRQRQPLRQHLGRIGALALTEAVAAGRVKQGDRVLFVAFGSG